MAGGGVKINNISITGGANGKTPTFKIENGHLFNKYGTGDWNDLGQVKGTDGTNGTNGLNGRGITSITKTSSEGAIDTYTILYTDNTTSTFTVTNGTGNTGGTFTILSTDWSNGSVTKQITGLGANDKIDIGALTYADQEKINEAQLFVTASTGSITITAQTTPSTDIAFQYFITKGVA